MQKKIRFSPLTVANHPARAKGLELFSVSRARDISG